MHKIILSPTLLLLIFLCGCSTVYYQDRAVTKARAFLLKSDELELTRAQIEYVKFNKPVILMSELLQASPFGYYQFCITWKIPGIDEAAMVFGFSDQRMIDWSPNRLIMRDFSPWDQNRQRAVEQARLYGHSLERELGFLTVHSMFHLLGYDHEEEGIEARIMREKEEAVLGSLALSRDETFVANEEDT